MPCRPSTSPAPPSPAAGTGRAKKSGAGGKYTWGGAMVEDGDEALDPADPNYDSGALCFVFNYLLFVFCVCVLVAKDAGCWC